MKLERQLDKTQNSQPVELPSTGSSPEEFDSPRGSTHPEGKRVLLPGGRRPGMAVTTPVRVTGLVPPAQGIPRKKTFRLWVSRFPKISIACPSKRNTGLLGSS